jgi:hypothetical protein
VSPLIFVPRPDPLTVLIPAWCVYWGVTGIPQYFFRPAASSGAISPVGAYVFFVGMLLCGGALLYGMYRRDLKGLKVRRGANVTLGLQCLFYSGWTVYALGAVRPHLLVAWLLTVAGAAFWDAVRLNRALNPKEVDSDGVEHAD